MTNKSLQIFLEVALLINTVKVSKAFPYFHWVREVGLNSYPLDYEKSILTSRPRGALFLVNPGMVFAIYITPPNSSTLHS